MNSKRNLTVSNKMIYTTLNKLKTLIKCELSFNKILKYVGKAEADDEQLSMEAVVDGLDIYHAIWCIQHFPEYDKQWKHLAVFCMKHYWPYTMVVHGHKRLDVLAEDFINGKITIVELTEAFNAKCGQDHYFSAFFNNIIQVTKNATVKNPAIYKNGIYIYGVVWYTSSAHSRPILTSEFKRVLNTLS